MDHIPSEFVIAGVLMPPLLVASLLGIAASALTGAAFNRVRLSRYVFYPPLALLALAVLYTCAIVTFVIEV
jgi:hypothetical protein